MRPAIALASALLACGPDKGDDSSTAADTTAATSTPTGDTTDTAEPTTGGQSCAIYQPDELGPAVEITLMHAGTDPIWVPAASCGGLPALRILDADNHNLFDPGDSCTPTQCHEFLALDSCELACDDCAPPLLVRIDPGASILVQWPGGFGEALEMTAACAPGTDCQRTCLRPTRAPAAAYKLELPAFTECTGACDCDPPSADGWCPLFSDANPGSPTVFSVTLDYPAVTAIDLPISTP